MYLKVVFMALFTQFTLINTHIGSAKKVLTVLRKLF